ncbi:MAG TPA: GAF domain-containing sensor histidine kinase [Pseudonocardiaceae bacterium]|nr:GAF domain-containing sensor histidine kinase [Pseudonocardiaceae bacterium]
MGGDIGGDTGADVDTDTQLGARITAGDLGIVRRLSAAVLAVSRHLDTGEALQTIVSIARELLGAEYAALGTPDGAGSFAQFVVAGISDEQQARIGPIPRQHGLLAVMLTDPRPQRLPDIRDDPRFSWWPAAHPEMDTFLGMPILDGDEIIGALYLANKPGGFTAADEELLSILAAHAAIALTHARLYERGRELSIEQERARLAHELHDAVAQKLFSLRLTAQAAMTTLAADPGRARDELGEVISLAAEAADELRATVAELRPADLDSEGLVGTLRKQIRLADRAGRSVHGPRLEFAADDPPVLPPAQQVALLRITQESLHNALRHANAGTVRVSLAGTADGGAELTIVDDGVGFDVGHATPRGLGLRSIRDRARSVRGRVLLSSAPGEGTSIRVEVPGGRPA